MGEGGTAAGVVAATVVVATVVAATVVAYTVVVYTAKATLLGRIDTLPFGKIVDAHNVNSGKAQP